jgi:hypothetical protein
MFSIKSQVFDYNCVVDGQLQQGKNYVICIRTVLGNILHPETGDEA